MPIAEDSKTCAKVGRKGASKEMMKKVIKKIKDSATKKTAVKKTAKKVSASAGKKTKGRSVLKGIGNDQLYPMIEKEAYRLFESRGYAHGNNMGDWYQAEKNVLAKLKK